VAQLVELLHYMTEQRASDMLVKVGSPPHLRIDGKLVPSELAKMSPSEIEDVCAELLPVDKAEELAERGEVDVGHSVSGLGRFRMNVYRQRGSLSMAIRRVVPGAPSLTNLNLIPTVERLANEESGLIVVAGPAGSGRTTTIAAIIDQINATKALHIVTVEDPIEVLHADKMSLVSQREVGTDTGSLLDALRRVGRQNADVIFVSELRDGDAAVEVLAEAASGRLVLTTMGTLSAAETVCRIVEMCPPQQQGAARQTLAGSLRGVICQRLLERADGRGRIPAVEVLVNTSKMVEAISSGQDEAFIDRLVSEGEYHGMQSFDRALFDLYRDNKVGLDEVLAVAGNAEDLRIAFQQAGLSAAY
jgi:twitching motility protein PilT